MSATSDALPRYAAPRPSRPPGFWLRAVGSVCLILAAGVAGYIWWVLYGTGLETARAQDELRSGFVSQVNDDPVVVAPTAESNHPPIGTAVAEILIPKIDLDMIVVEGTGTRALTKGPGHYTGTAMPWAETGRVGIAGHRTTYLHPFQNLDDLVPGDRITLRTEHGRFDYEVTRVFVIPAVGSGTVLEPTVRPTLVLTTCHPLFSSTERLIVEADRLPADTGTP